jgi:hypothetical protein
MKRKHLSLSTFLLLSLLIGFLPLLSCATGPGLPPFTKIEKIPDDTGLVYIYRPGSAFGAAVSYNVKANGIPIATLTPGVYYPYFAKPGEIEFSAKTESTSSITLDVKPGQTYYIKGTVGVGIIVGRPRLALVSTEVGEKEIIKCKLCGGVK